MSKKYKSSASEETTSEETVEQPLNHLTVLDVEFPEAATILAEDPTAPPVEPETIYPEHVKLAKISDKSQAIGEFVEWLNSQEIFLAEWVKEPGRHGTSELTYARKNVQQLLAEFFGIDQSKIDKEKAAML